MKQQAPWRTAGALVAATIALSGCATGAGGHPASSGSVHSPHATSTSPAAGMGHGHAADGGPAPSGMAKSADPSFAPGTRVTLAADHMPGMMDAPATIASAYRSTAYSVDYMPTDGGPEVTDHRWVVQEELRGAGDQPLEVGDTAVMTADHMPGMKGATAQVASVWTGTVYMVDYEADGMTMKNHQWVVEDEVRPAS